MKQLTAYALALLLLASTTAALAGGKDRGHSRSHYYKQHSHHANHYRHGYGRGHHDRHYRRSYYSSYLGAALLGSALTYSLYHRHNGVSCYSKHSTNQYQPRNSYSEVVGCLRIERLADGSERRVEVPRSQCQ